MSLTDPFGRDITYLRMSITDRCDLRCTYCMPARMRFLPKPEVLTLEEIDRLCSAFIRKGVRRLRLTGGEPLVRRDAISLIEALSRHLKSAALDELTLTTNATQLARHADALARCGVRRLNISLDTLDPERFSQITRGGELARVLEGIDAALAAGLHIKINAVALERDNRAELPAMIEWAHQHGMDITLIEVMPMGAVEAARHEQFASLAEIRRELESLWTLSDLPDRTAGPSRYVRVAETGGRLGFITPLTGNFCDGCNRVRVTCTGRVYQCLGRDAHADLRAPLRASEGDELLEAAIDAAIAHKPFGHDFEQAAAARRPAVPRHMSTTGG